MIALAAAQLLALAGGMCYEDAECSLPNCQVAIRVCAGGRLRPCTCVVPEPPPPPVLPKPRWSVWNDALTKIRGPALLSTPVLSASIAIARNEFEAFQLVVEPPAGIAQLDEFTLELNDLTSSGQSLVGNGGRIRIFREHWLSVGTRSGADGGAGPWPDPLIPHFDETANERRNAFFRTGEATPRPIPVQLEPELPRLQVYYVEIYLPPTPVFGTLTGTLVARWKINGQSDQFSVPVTVTPYPFSIPSKSSLPTFYNASWTAICDEIYAGQACTDGAQSARRTTEADFIQYMIDHRLTPRLGDFGVSASPRNDGAFFAQYGRFLDGVGARRSGVPVVLPDAPVTSFSLEPHWRGGSTDRAPQLYVDWLAAMEPEWRPLAFDYTCDEPDNDGSECFGGAQIPVRAGIVPAEVPTLVAAPNENPPVNGDLCADTFIQAYAPSINIAVANSTHVAGSTDAGAFTSLGQCPGSAVQDVWVYQSCSVHGCEGEDPDIAGQPNLMVDVGCTTPLGVPVACGELVSGAQNRAMQWLTYYYGFTGELYYDFLAAFIAVDGQGQGLDPWSNVNFSGGNGDGTLLYPWSQTHVGGQTRIPVPSYRLKILRDGMEDYEYLVILDYMCPGAGEARATIETLFGNPVETRHVNVPVQQFLAVRNSMGNRIAALNSGSALCRDGTTPRRLDPPPPASCQCNGTGMKCFGSQGDWWWAGQVCNGQGVCVSRECPEPP